MSSNGNGTALTVHGVLERYKHQIAAALPKHMNPDRMARLALTETRRNRMLAQADAISLFGAVVQASQLGLEIGAGGAWLVPFRNNDLKIIEVQCIPDYRGLIKLTRNSGDIGRFEAHPVYDGDYFEYEFGLHPRLSHRPGGETDPKKIVFAYAVAEAKDGSWRQFDVMTRAEIDAIRARSKAKNNGPWVTDFGAMACKTVVKRLCKYLPQSPELATALQLDDDAEIGRQNMRSVLDAEEFPDAPAEEERPAIEAPRRKSEAAADDQGGEGQAPADEDGTAASAENAAPEGKKKGKQKDPPDETKLVSKPQIETLRAAAAEQSVPVAELCEAMEIEKVEDLPANKVSDALDWLAGATAS